MARIPKTKKPELLMVTPERAMEMLEHNKLNRPLTQGHVNRLVRQIHDGKWVFNGDTIKVGTSGDVLDGQHRLWAIIESRTAVETVVVYNVPREAFATIDSIRKPRSGADILSMNGVTQNRREIAAALSWLIRWQRGILEEYRAPRNKIENSDIEEAFAHHPDIDRAVQRCKHIRSLGSPSLMSFIYYIVASRDPDLAERMANTLENPAGVSIDDPFFRLRAWFLSSIEKGRRREALTSIALCFKSVNAAHEGRDIAQLSWRNQGARPEPFPKLEI